MVKKGVLYLLSILVNNKQTITSKTHIGIIHIKNIIIDLPHFHRAVKTEGYD